MVVHDPATRTYSLPAEHAAWLTDAAGPDNLARLTVLLPMLAEVEQGIVRCFREGGGLSYADFERFHELMAADSRAVVDATLLDVVVPHVDGTGRSAARRASTSPTSAAAAAMRSTCWRRRTRTAGSSATTSARRRSPRPAPRRPRWG